MCLHCSIAVVQFSGTLALWCCNRVNLLDRTISAVLARSLALHAVRPGEHAFHAVRRMYIGNMIDIQLEYTEGNIYRR